MAVRMATIDFDVVVARVVPSLFGESFILKQDQNICIKAVCCDDRDVFAQLPTGFGKSIIISNNSQSESSISLCMVKDNVKDDKICKSSSSVLSFKLCKNKLEILYQLQGRPRLGVAKFAKVTTPR